MGQSSSTPAMVRPGKRRSFRANWKPRRSHSSQGSLSATCNFLDTDLKVDQLNINIASEEELMTLPGVTRAIAQSIVEYRRVIGRFIKVEDLALVPGIGANKLDLIRPEICVTRKKNLSRSSSHAQSIDSLPSQDSLSITRSLYKGPSISKALNLNTASVFDLMAISTLNQELAANIVEYRQRRGHFRSIDDLVKVKGINSFRLSAIRSHLYVEDYLEESKSLPLNGSFNSSTLQSTPIKNGRLPGHRKSLSAPIKYIPLNNGVSTPVNDIFELLSAYSPRPIVEEDFNYEHHGRSAVRIASWYLQDFSCDKANNPGVLEVISRTILENKFSLIAVQGIEDPVSLSKICQELNRPLIRRVSDWKDNSRDWLFSTEDKSTLGFIYDNKRIQKLRHENITYENVDALLTSFQVNCYKFEIINIYLKNDQLDLSTLNELFKIDSKSNKIFAGDITHLIKGKVENLDLQEGVFVIPKMTSTNTGSGQPKVRLYDNLIMANFVENRYTGVHGVVRQGLSHLAIPRGWTWGGFVSDHCPVWCELFTD